MSLHENDLGGMTVANSMRVSNEPEKRSEILGDIRLLLDALEETCDTHTQAVNSTNKLLDMIKPGPQADAMRKELLSNLEKFEALHAFHKHMIASVRKGTFKRMAELFDK
jgi:hypothetical protein